MLIIITSIPVFSEGSRCLQAERDRERERENPRDRCKSQEQSLSSRGCELQSGAERPANLERILLRRNRI
jgi:hypothetical protein